MIPPKLPNNEKQRQIAVEKYELLDTLPEESYDNITSLMSYICETPISLITLLDGDRNFIKSHHGISMSESPREISFCGHAINSDDPLTIIEDSRKDERFFDNPLVSKHDAIFYAGAPLIDSNGYKLGTLCVYDTKPRKLTDQQQQALISMSKQVVSLFEHRYQNLKLLETQERLQMRNEDLTKFAGVVSHDLKSPLANIISITELIEYDGKGKLDEETLQYLQYLKSSSYSLRDYIDGILKFYKSDDLLKNKSENISFDEIITELKKITDTEGHVTFECTNCKEYLIVNKSALMQILINLITNAIKYHKGVDGVVIQIDLKEKDDFYEFSVTDNGDGIPKEYLNKIFDLFSVVGVADKDGNMGTGIGLATVKKIVTNLGGEIKVFSKEGEGSTFIFTIAKLFQENEYELQPHTIQKK
ncbi:ATPase [Aquimarina aggregata]|uniref:histidine kinase n=1 Tax=Aquimarina aggregata TaxID=1642818 RepID=A0A163AHY9_9FLAO|nr:GAF domain-containing sensor histidine kinase [Aquimarina aggregata]KZS40558.1 ATPase [Aquimarina aggregata]